MRMTLLLLSSRVLRRGSLGKPSSLTMTLSERSRLSNWFCMSSHMLTDYSRKSDNKACCVALQCTAAVWTARTVYAGYTCLGKYLCGSQIFYGRQLVACTSGRIAFALCLYVGATTIWAMEEDRYLANRFHSLLHSSYTVDFSR